MRKPELKLVRWYSHRNANDGRRDSAIGVNTSKWHIPSGEFYTICGRQIGAFEHYSKDDAYRGLGILVTECCKICLKKKLL